jgi:hypothetical protein
MQKSKKAIGSVEQRMKAIDRSKEQAGSEYRGAT